MELEGATLKAWSNLARVVYTRTYARKDNGKLETWPETVERMIEGNTRNHDVSAEEKDRLRYFLLNRKASPAGRGVWFSGSKAHYQIGGVALNNCWFVTADDWMNFVVAQDLLMLGGGVGMSVEREFVNQLPRVKKNVVIEHKATKDADFIVPDSRQGWCELLRRVLKAYFVTGKGFTYSTICIRGAGEPINGFGGTASGPLPLIAMVEKISTLLQSREGKKLRPLDAADVLCCIGEMVVAGNVRRSAIIILGDAWDKEYLKAKRWDLAVLPSQRDKANWSVVCDDVDDLHPLFWQTYEIGEPFGLVNRTNMQKFARIGELKPDGAIGVNPCGEACLEDGEPCNLMELALPNLDSIEEFEEAARLMFRWAKRVTCEHYHHPKSDAIIKKNRRVGIGITGCLRSELFKADILDRVYAAIKDEDEKYSAFLGVPLSIRYTVVKPSGTMSKVMDMDGYEGIHAAYDEYFIQRIRFSAHDPLVPLLREAGHYIEPVLKLDGSIDLSTVVVDFYVATPKGYPVAGKDWDTWKQLEVLKMAQKHWADQSVSVTVYYKREEIPQLKAWLKENLSEMKTISFLCHSDHGFKQAPKESITKEEYERLSANIKPVDLTSLAADNIDLLADAECAGGACPVR